MKRGFLALCLVAAYQFALAGGTDYWYQGLMKDKLHTYEFSAEWWRYPQYASSPQGGPMFVAIELNRGLTRATFDPVNPSQTLPPPVTGCAVVLDGEKVISLVCGPSASLLAFQGVVYVSSAEGARGKSSLTCVRKCSSQVPKRFNLINWDSGED
jgi:hypothetical protein